ncbi:MAG: glycosyltransferase family 2 protein [Cyclobacteriaceae bacterium]|nr:glycosyltransferase family 2 protein [Cyclobacteriaceae bacterium]
MNYYNLTVIIPSYNGAENIINCVQSLLNQKKYIEEIIIVIDGSTDNTSTLLQETINDEKIRIIEQTNMGRSGARNKGAHAAKGSLLLFIDDDISLEANCIESHIKHHNSILNSMLVGAVFLAPQLNGDVMKYRMHLEWKWYDSIPKYPDLQNRNKLFVTAAHLSMPKSVFQNLNGFDEKLKDAEDFDLGLRALDTSIRIFFDINLLGWHYDNTTCLQYIKRRRSYEKAHNILLQINEKYREIKDTQVENSLIKRLIYRLLASKYWVDFIDSEKLIWLPKSLRYRLYSAVIWSLGKYHTEVNLD